jgi:hypothetical protein
VLDEIRSGPDGPNCQPGLAQASQSARAIAFSDGSTCSTAEVSAGGVTGMKNDLVDERRRRTAPCLKSSAIADLRKRGAGCVRRHKRPGDESHIAGPGVARRT